MSERAFPACLVGKFVHVEWAPGQEADWHRFYVARQSNGWLLLRGANDGDVKHSGDSVWCSLDSISSVSVDE